MIILLLTVFLFSQVPYEGGDRKIEVPVRVFEKGEFVDGLSYEDFEVYEDGVLQDVEAFYLVDKKKVVRKKEQEQFSPPTARNYYFIFQVLEYDPKLKNSIYHFFENVLLPGDSLMLMTPKKPYFLSSKVIRQKPREEIAKDTLKILRKDIKIESSAYRSQMRSLSRIVSSISGQDRTDVDSSPALGDSFSLSMMLNRYRNSLEKMEELRIVDQNLFLQFAARLKSTPGQKNLYFFYEREYRPELSTGVMNTLISNYQGEPNVIGDLQDLFQFYNRTERINSKRIKRAFADASVCFNFLFVDREARGSIGISMREQSEDYFKAFSETARATGGVIENSQNPSAGFRNALKANQSYYLLYYSPKDYQPDKQYKEIQVRIPDKPFKIQYRHGYYAN